MQRLWGRNSRSYRVVELTMEGAWVPELPHRTELVSPLSDLITMSLSVKYIFVAFSHSLLELVLTEISLP